MNELTQRADIATRFKAGRCPNPGGRPSIAWLKEKVETVDPETGQTKLQEMADHLIEVATKWEVIQRGESMPVASARDSVEACRLLWQALSLIRKTPPSDEEQLLKLAEHFRQVETDRFAFALQLLGERAKAMSDEEKAAFFNSLVVAQRGSVEMFIRMAKSYDQGKEQEQLTDGQPAENPGEVSAAPAPPDDGSEPTP